jgi:uncharacterized protein (DUF849 family)
LAPEALAAAAVESVAAGAAEIHMHVRGPDARESLAPADVASAVRAVRAVVHGVVLGVSTGAWIVPDPATRHDLVARWETRPDVASVNFHEAGAAALARLLIERGVAVEAGIIDARAAGTFLACPDAHRCLRLLIEPQESTMSGALATLEAIESILDRAGSRLPKLLHGVDDTAWPFIDVARARGYDTRIGLEDVLTMPDGSPAPGNGQLVAEVVRRTKSSLEP